MSDPVSRARALATRLHAGQLRKGRAREPYITHPEEVARLVAAWGGDADTVAAAWLHDTIEDCEGFTPDDLAHAMGPRIAALVQELTDDATLSEPERRRAQIAHAPGKSRQAALIKLADKASNIGALVGSPPEGWSRARLVAYVDWGVAVVDALPAGLPPEGLADFRRRVTAARLAFG